MKLIRYEDTEGQTGYAHQTEAGSFRVEGSLTQGYTPTQDPVTVARLLAPVQPTQIIAIGLNYMDHAKETGARIPQYPVVFWKGINSVQHPDAPIVLPKHLTTEQPDLEVELAVLIGKDCLNATEENALDFVFGYTIANDVSARDWQARERSSAQWGRAKSFDTFCPIGPCLVTDDEIPDPQSLRIQSWKNDFLMQDSNTSEMIFSVRQLIAFLSADTTIPAGTLILTGTPAGVGLARDPQVWIEPGDTITLTIEKIGTLVNSVE